MKKFVSVFAVFVSCVHLVYSQQIHLKNIADSLMVIGMQVTMLNNNDELTYVIGNAKPNTFVTANTVFQCASMSKVVAAYVFLKLYDEGVYDLDVPLSKYFVYDRLESDSLGSKITARMVLNHTSGLVNWETSPRSIQWKSTPLKVQFAPGSKFLYSGEAFYYLQLVVEHLTGKSFETLTQELVCTPFEMSRSGFVVNDKLKTDLASGYNEIGEELDLKDFIHPNAAFTMLTTSADYMKFIKNVFIDQRGLKSTTFDMMINSSVVTDSKVGKEAERYIRAGLGVRIQYNEKGQAIWHTGSNTGFRSFFIVYPGYKEAIVVLTNSANGAKVKKDIMPLFFGDKQTYWFLK